MPAWRWASTEQKNVYVPGLSWAVSDVLDCETVALAATFLLPCWMVTLWGTCESLVKSILTAPALSVSDFLSYASCPLGSAARVRAGAPPLGGACAGGAWAPAAGWTPGGGGIGRAGAFACATFSFGGLEAVTTAIVMVSATSRTLTAITARS